MGFENRIPNHGELTGLDADNHSQYGGLYESFRSGRYYCGQQIYGFTTAIVLPLSRLYAARLNVRKTVTFNQIALYVNIGGAGNSAVRVGIYTDTNGYPSTKQATFPDIETKTSGLKTVAINQTMAPGTYWVVFFCVALNSPNVQSTDSFYQLMTLGVGDITLVNSANGYYIDGYSDLPNTFPTGAAYSNDSLGIVWFRVL